MPAKNLLSEDPRSLLLASNMSAYQIGAVAITVSLCALDGFDVLAITLAAPGIVKEWAVGKAALGIVFSMGLVGMAFGSLFISPLADLFGRRKVIMLCLAVMALGMASTAMAGSVVALAAMRAVTGVGIGGMISVIYPLAAEYANARRRDLAVGITAVGFGIGGVVGGLVVAEMLRHFDWRSIFVFGGAVALVMGPIVYLGLPESVPFLIARSPPGALDRVNAFLARCAHPPVAMLPAAQQGSLPVRRGDIFKSGMLRITLMVTLMNALFALSFYYLLNWLPQMVAELGFSASQAAHASVAINLGGIVGGTALGWASSRLGLKRLLLFAFCATACMIALFGRVPAHLPLVLATAAMTGVVLYGCSIGIFAVVARSFPAHSRATGTGFVVGIGRISSATAPSIAGFMLAAGMGRGQVAVIMALPCLLAAVILAVLPVRAISSKIA